MAQQIEPNRTHYKLIGGVLQKVDIELPIAARAGESINAFLDRCCQLYEWHIGDRVSFLLRGRHITQARVMRSPGQAETSISVSPAMLAAIGQVAEHLRGSSTFVIDENGVLIHQQTEFYVDPKDRPLDAIAEAVNLADDDQLCLSDSTVQILRRTLRSGAIISRYA